MAFPDSMFLFEIVVEELKSFIDCREFYIKSKFMDIFKLTLKDPNDLDPLISTTRRPKKKIKVRDENISEQKPPIEGKVQSGQSILFTSPIATLITAMKNYPIEITLYNKDDHSKKVGSIHVPWSPLYIDYLYLLATKVDPAPIVVSGGNNVYDDNTSRRIATILLKMKLTHLRDKLTSYGRSLSVPTQHTKIIHHSLFKSQQHNTVSPIIDNPGTIKTVYSGGKRKKKTSEKSETKKSKIPFSINEDAIHQIINKEVAIKSDEINVERNPSVLSMQQIQNENTKMKVKTSTLYLVKSDNHLNKKIQDDVIRTKSCTFINKKQFNLLNYVFGDTGKRFGNRIICVGYFTVENEYKEGSSSKASSPIGTPCTPKDAGSMNCDFRDENRDSFRICGIEEQNNDDPCKPCEEDLNKISIIQCDKIRCNILERRKLPLPPDDAIHLDLRSLKKKRLEELNQTVEDVVGGMKAKMKYDDNTCTCECECTFGFIKHTTYCTVCGGYEKPGEDLPKEALMAPFPCPVYHKLIDKNKQKSTSGSDRSKMCDSKNTSKKGSKSPAPADIPSPKNVNKKGSKASAPADNPLPKNANKKGSKSQARPDSPSPYIDTNKEQSKKKKQEKKVTKSKFNSKGKSSKSSAPPDVPSPSDDSDSEYSRKKKKENKDERFIFNYGYTAPQIGHTRCGLPCTGGSPVLNNAVPKHMGWLWTAEDVPGMKFRPSWKPGCVHKRVLHLLRMAKDPGIILAKKKKKPEKAKKPVKRPLLTVSKKDGEYTVTMETMKAYSKPRALNQQPYEDKPLLQYMIGRTEEENRERRKRKEREQRRLLRDQRDFIQSAFADMCKEICLKTYQQALGILPDTETPDCSCYPNHPGAEDTNLDRSCSCSEHDVSFGSDTDSDEWLVEFTPPNAFFDPTYKGKKITKQDNETQYTYLDYRVKLLDKSGNQVVRFFKGPDGKTQCSDLGGFWNPDHKWLEINVDGFIGPDDRWAPFTFIGPHGDHVDCETGKFQDTNGTWLTVGVDGYVDATGNWKFYLKSKSVHPQKKSAKKSIGDKKDAKKVAHKPSDTTWSCFGDANPVLLSKLGILGHGQDKKLLLHRLTDMLKHGEDVKIPEPSMVPRISASRRGKKGMKGADTFESSFYSGKSKCKHSVSSHKGIIAVDGRGNKTYFRLRDYKNRRPAERLTNLKHQGISTSSFHVPCLSSFINAEMLKKQQYEKFLKNQSPKFSDMEYGTSTNSKEAATQINYRYRYAI